MAHPYFHALESVKKWGGVAEDYLAIHSWFDASKSHMADFRHRALRHHSLGIFECEQVFGVTIVNSDNRVVPVRFIGEQHVLEDLKRIPSVKDWFSLIKVERWMGDPAKLESEKEAACSRQPSPLILLSQEISCDRR